MKTIKPPGRAWRTWPTKAEVLKDYAVTASQLGALVRHRRLTAYSCQDETVRFSPTELAAAFALEPDDSAAAEAEAAALDMDAPLPADPQLAAMTVLVRVLHETSSMLKDSREAMVRVMDSATKPMEKGLAFYEKVAGMQDSRIQRLENGWMEGLIAREGLLNQNHDRELLSQQLANEHAIKKQALDTAIGLAPRLLSQWKMGKAAKTALDFLVGIDDSLLAAAAEMGLAPKEQIESLRELRKGVAEQRQAEAKAAEAKAAKSTKAAAPEVKVTPPPSSGRPPRRRTKRPAKRSTKRAQRSAKEATGGHAPPAPNGAEPHNE